jgi:poly(A) polymerase
MRYVQKMVNLHMRPINLIEDGVTDSAIRRLLFEAGDDIEDLMLLCKADITSKDSAKVERFRQNYDIVMQKLQDIEAKDHIRNFQPPVDGLQIMQLFNLQPSPTVGILKNCLKDAILDGIIPNEYQSALNFLLQKAAEMNLHPSGEGQ